MAPYDGTIAQSALRSLQARIGGDIRGEKLYPIGPFVTALAPLRPESELQRRWHVVQCEPSQEARVADGLERELKFDCYYPVEHKKIRVHALRHKIVSRPMLPGYVFGGFDAQCERWWDISSLRGAVRVLKIGDNPAPVSDRIIEHLRRLEIERRGKTNIQRPPILLKVGACVRLLEPLSYAGLLGFVQVVDQDRGRVAIELELFGQRVPHWLRPEQVEAV